MIRFFRDRLNAKDESGFTLIELLVVVIIIGILAAIAIPVFLRQRERGWAASVESDLRNAAMSMETAYVTQRAYPAALPTDVKVSPLVTLTVKRSGTQDFCIEGLHSSLQGSAAGTVSAPGAPNGSVGSVYAIYDSAKGGVIVTNKC